MALSNPKVASMEPSEDSRWCKSFLIRYAIGAMVGALCVNGLTDFQSRRDFGV